MAALKAQTLHTKRLVYEHCSSLIYFTPFYSSARKNASKLLSNLPKSELKVLQQSIRQISTANKGSISSSAAHNLAQKHTTSLLFQVCIFLLSYVLIFNSSLTNSRISYYLILYLAFDETRKYRNFKHL